MKKYPCGGGSHPFIDALIALMEEHSFDYRDVDEVEVQQSYESDYILFGNPRTDLEAKFSVVYNVAATLVQGRIDIDTFPDQMIGDPRIQEMMDKVCVKVLSRWEVGLERAEGRWPRAQSSGYTYRPVKVCLEDGRVFTINVLPSELLGAPRNPRPFESISAKFENNASLALSPGKVESVVQLWARLDGVQDLSEAVGSLVARG